MTAPLTSSEEFVLELCRKSCLRFWCYNNPHFVRGKELCDILVVFGKHILIFSVKDISLKKDSEIETEEQREILYTRWNRKAVKNSIAQIYGAEKSLLGMTDILNSKGDVLGQLPSLDGRIVHRLAIAFGSRCETEIISKDYEQGFVHVMNEDSFSKILSELDTITELVEYLSAKEELTRQSEVFSLGGEANLLAYYLSNGRKFKDSTEVLMIAEDAWDQLQADPLFKNRKRDETPSYLFDEMIDFIGSEQSSDIHGNPLTWSQTDMALRVLAQETRVNRRALVVALKEFLQKGVRKEIDARLVRNVAANVIYIWRFFSKGETPEEKISELVLRSHLATRLAGNAEIVVGIGFDKLDNETGFGITLTYLAINELTSEDIEKAEIVARKVGILTEVIPSELQVCEYPRS